MYKYGHTHTHTHTNDHVMILPQILPWLPIHPTRILFQVPKVACVPSVLWLLPTSPALSHNPLSFTVSTSRSISHFGTFACALCLEDTVTLTYPFVCLILRSASLILNARK